jgi:membrane fusion protein, multidrug efflux system
MKQNKTNRLFNGQAESTKIPEERKTDNGQDFTWNGDGAASLEVSERAERRSRGSPPEKEQDVQGKRERARLRTKRLIIGGLASGVVLISVFLYWLHARNFESTDDAYTTTHVHDISPRVSGTVETVNVDDNQFVKAGQTLVVLDQRDFKVALEQARAQLLQRRAAVDQAEATFDRATSDYDRATELDQRKVISKADLDGATAAYKAADAAVAAVKADVAAAEAAVDNARLQLSYTKIVAPVDGVIAKKTVETGARIQPGQPLMAVVERNVWVLGNFKETQLARVRVGQHVDVKIDAVPDHLFSAHIDSIQPGTGSTFALLPPDNATGNFTKIVQRVPVKIVFDNLHGYQDRVVAGLSCTPKIDLRTRLREGYGSASRRVSQGYAKQVGGRE